MVHGPFGTLHTDREPVPVVMPAAQPRGLHQGEGGPLGTRPATGWPLAQLGLQAAGALDKGSRWVRERHRLVPPRETGLSEAVECTAIVDPGEPPSRECGPTPCRLEEIPPPRRPTKGAAQ